MIFPPRIALFLLAMLALVGCQPQSIVGTLPAPNFNGPIIAQLPTPTPTPPKNTPNPPRKTYGYYPPVAIPNGIPSNWVPRTTARPWYWIVIHHSATPTGGAAAFDRMHRDKGWDELGYHFVVGNGTDTGNGQIEVGPRWPKQKWGAHTKSPDNRFNEYGIGICMVGNFDISRPSSTQLRSLAYLVAYLMRTYHIPADRVLGHRDCKSTDCPGSNVSIPQIRQMASQILAQGTFSTPPLANSRSR